jgi:HEAT repeat protein
VRQTAAQALERVADSSVLDGLLAGLDDTAVTVRFSVVAALGHAAGDGSTLSEAQRTLLVTRLEALLQHDTDPGVRSRAAAALGQYGSPAVLPSLWKRVLAGEDSRVQEKAWLAFVDIVARSGSLEVVQEWDGRLKQARHLQRRALLLNEVYSRWQKREDTRAVLGSVMEALVQAQLEAGKWAAAFPLVHELLAKQGTDAEVERRLRWLLRIGEQALKEGNHAEARRAAQEAQPYLARSPILAVEFAKLQKQ